MAAHTYDSNNQLGWCGYPSRGAALGRCSDHTPGFTGTLRVARVEIDAGGYDRLGTYWGTPSDLWWVSSEDGEVDYCIRAKNFVDASHVIHAKYPGCDIVEAAIEAVEEDEDEHAED